MFTSVPVDESRVNTTSLGNFELHNSHRAEWETDFRDELVGVWKEGSQGFTNPSL